MSRHRVLKYINLGIAAALVVLLFFAYRYAYRPLPKTSGTLTAPIFSKATVSRDSLGVPHIVAANEQDVLFLQGFVTAQDRLFQMDTLRRLAAGELAQVFGRSVLRSDRQSRRLRLRSLAEKYYRTLCPEDRAVLAAYARGVNFFIETHAGRLPLEFSLLRYDPRPWSVVDSLLVALETFRMMTSSWRIELRKELFLQGGDAKKVDFLFPVRGSGEFQPGSNAWVISGAQTASKQPILANDPHLDLSLPSIWYMIHLHAPGLNVAGVSIPGLPCVIIGHNDRIAWGLTNLEFDVQDLYIEKFDARTGRYLFRGRMEQARAEREIIRVKGERSLSFLTWVTRDGPIFVEDRGRFLSLRWVGAELNRLEFPFLKLDCARNWPEFTAALSRFPGPASNFVYADVEGNIGYQVAGKLPIRKTFDGDVPVDGSSGNFEWQGFIPFEQLPSAFNPAPGTIITANQDPFGADFPYRVDGNFAPPYRYQQIRALLAAKKTWRPDEMLTIQTDVYSSVLHFVAREVLGAYDRRGQDNPSLAGAVSLLRSWNGQMETDMAAPLIATLIYLHVRTAIADRASSGRGPAYDIPMAPAVIEKLLRARPKGWFPDYDQLLLRCFVDAIEEGRRIQGRNVNKWKYGRYNQFSLRNPVVSELPVVGPYFNIGPVPMSGSPTTVKQVTRRRAPSMRMVVDLSDWDRSLLNITPGESGQALSRHYKDQWNAYYAGRSFPMQFRNVDVKATLTIVPEQK